MRALRDDADVLVRMAIYSNQYELVKRFAKAIFPQAYPDHTDLLTKTNGDLISLPLSTSFFLSHRSREKTFLELISCWKKNQSKKLDKTTSSTCLKPIRVYNNSESLTYQLQWTSIYCLDHYCHCAKTPTLIRWLWKFSSSWRYKETGPEAGHNLR